MVALAGLRSNVLEPGSWNDISSVSTPYSLLQDIMHVHVQSEEFANAQDLFEVRAHPITLRRTSLSMFHPFQFLRCEILSTLEANSDFF
jgi:hypothetical protein